MGQQISNQTHTAINKLPEKVIKHASLVRESGFLTYEEFLGRVAELNDVLVLQLYQKMNDWLFHLPKVIEADSSLPSDFIISPIQQVTSPSIACLIYNIGLMHLCFSTAKLASGQDKHLLFEVQPGSDSSALWKVVVRIVCTKINKTSGIVEASRIMNLYQFIQLYKDITSQAAGVLAQSSASEGTAASLSSVSSCQASLWMGRVKQLTEEEECCICMDGRADLILPCAHSFCQKCIDKWSDRHRNCPICRLQVTGTNDSWVVSDAPTEDDIASYILNMVDEAGQPHRP